MTTPTTIRDELEKCPTCQGTGKIWKTKHDYLMNEPRNFTCPTCNGKGVLQKEIEEKI